VIDIFIGDISKDRKIKPLKDINPFRGYVLESSG
jgi:hypothetical protein